jgi:hypothetical protein
MTSLPIFARWLQNDASPFAQDVAAFIEANADRIEQLAQVLEAGGQPVDAIEGIESLDELHWDAIAELKSHLGAKAANASGTATATQERALLSAETWVQENLSQRSGRISLAVMLYMLDEEQVQNVVKSVACAVPRLQR